MQLLNPFFEGYLNTSSLGFSLLLATGHDLMLFCSEGNTHTDEVQSFWSQFEENLGKKSSDYHDIGFEKLCFQNVFHPHSSATQVFSNSCGLTSVFEKLYFCNGVVQSSVESCFLKFPYINRVLRATLQATFSRLELLTRNDCIWALSLPCSLLHRQVPGHLQFL